MYIKGGPGTRGYFQSGLTEGLDLISVNLLNPLLVGKGKGGVVLQDIRFCLAGSELINLNPQGRQDTVQVSLYQNQIILRRLIALMDYNLPHESP